MNAFPLQQPLPSGVTPTLQPRRRRPSQLALVGGFFAIYLLLHLCALGLSSQAGLFLWYFPAALSVSLLLLFGPKYLPVLILAPLPLNLLFQPRGLPSWVILGIAVSFACAHALAVVFFRQARLSPRLRQIKDVAGFLILSVLGPLLAALPISFLLLASGVLPADQMPGALRTILLSDALGVLTLGPALLLWLRPVVTLSWPPRKSHRPSLRPVEFMLQCTGLALTTWLVTRFSEPGTLHLKYLFFLPLFWMVMQGGMRVASLGFPVLSLALTLAILQGHLTSNAILGIQSFLVALFGVTLFLGASIEAHDAALSRRERGARRLNQLVEVTGAIPWEMDLETGRCGYLGLQIETLLGWPQEAWRKTPFWGEVVHPDDQLAFLRFLLGVSRPDGDHQLEFRLRTPTGGVHWVRAAAGLEPGPTPGRAIGFLFDIHSHRQAEENILRASLDEKDLLLREIHHRVKNNLQVVSSLLRLQASAQEDPALQRALQEAQERVHVIALIHQKLKHAPDFSRLDLPGYVRTLAERLVRSYASVPALIDLQVCVAEVEIGPDAPVPLGLILNELVANALQHAFPPGQGGSLDIDIGQDERGWITLRVADSGQGLPDSVDLDRGGLGFQLVQALTDQLGGTLELERRRGASFLLSFPPSKHSS
jgi:two-component sensor histidine kinase/integral membrane sensor domain MASE1